MSDFRCHRLEEQILRASAAIFKAARNPLFAELTVTHVTVSGDCGVATLFVRQFNRSPNADEQTHITTQLSKAAGFVRSQLGNYISIRHMPTIRFTFDTVYEHAARIDSLLGTHRTDAPCDTTQS